MLKSARNSWFLSRFSKGRGTSADRLYFPSYQWTACKCRARASIQSSDVRAGVYRSRNVAKPGSLYGTARTSLSGPTRRNGANVLRCYARFYSTSHGYVSFGKPVPPHESSDAMGVVFPRGGTSHAATRPLEERIVRWETLQSMGRHSRQRV